MAATQGVSGHPPPNTAGGMADVPKQKRCATKEFDCLLSRTSPLPTPLRLCTHTLNRVGSSAAQSERCSVPSVHPSQPVATASKVRGATTPSTEYVPPLRARFFSFTSHLPVTVSRPLPPPTTPHTSSEWYRQTSTCSKPLKLLYMHPSTHTYLPRTNPSIK